MAHPLVVRSIKKMSNKRHPSPEAEYCQAFYYVTIPAHPEVGWADLENIKLGTDPEDWKAEQLAKPRGLHIYHNHYVDRRGYVPKGTFEIHMTKNLQNALKAVEGKKLYEYPWRQDELYMSMSYSAFHFGLADDPEFRKASWDEKERMMKENIAQAQAKAKAEYESTKDGYVEIGVRIARDVEREDV